MTKDRTNLCKNYVLVGMPEEPSKLYAGVVKNHNGDSFHLANVAVINAFAVTNQIERLATKPTETVFNSHHFKSGSIHGFIPHMFLTHVDRVCVCTPDAEMSLRKYFNERIKQ